MGHIRAMGMAEAVSDGRVSLEAALADHLTANHYPPVSTDWVPHCIAAIEAVQEDEPERVITKRFTAGYVVEGLHLDAFLEDTIEVD